jgi:L-lysine exporter family protein LysE/ArgO
MLPPSFATGLAMCATLIVAIGAQNAFVLRQGLRREHVGVIVLFCAAADLLFIGAGVAGLAQILKQLPILTMALTLAGAGFIGCYGLYALRRALRPQRLIGAGSGNGSSGIGSNGNGGSSSPSALTLPAALTQVAGFTLLNPHVYLDTVLLMGSVGARQPDGQRLWFVAGAGLASALWFSALGFGARWLSPLFARPRAWQILDSVIALIMFVLAARLFQQATQG